MGKYPTVTDSILEEKMPYGFINDVAEKRTYQEYPDIYASCQGTDPGQFASNSPILVRRVFSRAGKILFLTTSPNRKIRAIVKRTIQKNCDTQSYPGMPQNQHSATP